MATPVFSCRVCILSKVHMGIQGLDWPPAMARQGSCHGSLNALGCWSGLAGLGALEMRNVCM